MSDKVVFIDDLEEPRNTYRKKLQRMFGDEYDILSLEPAPTIQEMISVLNSLDNIVMYFIDENLKYSGIAKYDGTELIEQIRMFDRKIPIYILTSDTSPIDEYLGDVEFVIDKAEWPVNKSNFAERFFRHLSTYKSICNDREVRFDELLVKSISNVLSTEEQAEFENLSLYRNKALADEGALSEKDLNDLEQKTKALEELKIKLTEVLNG